MSVSRCGKYCYECGCKTLHEKPGNNVALNLIMVMVLFLSCLIFWPFAVFIFLIWLGADIVRLFTPYRCVHCGSTN